MELQQLVVFFVFDNNFKRCVIELKVMQRDLSGSSDLHVFSASSYEGFKGSSSGK